MFLKAKAQVSDCLTAALKKAMAEGRLPEAEIPEFAVEVPADSTHGDFASNIAMVSARAFRKSPKMIADAILEGLSLEGTCLSRCEVAGAGFINFFLSESWYGDSVKAVLEEKENFGRSDFGKGKRYIVEYVSANPTGPMHIGNARGGAIGDGLASVLDWAGFEVCREFYINDAGNQIAKFALSLDRGFLSR